MAPHRGLDWKEHLPVRRSYTIAFTPRSGSSEICALRSRNGLGAPSEFFQALPSNTTGQNAHEGTTTANQILSVIESHIVNSTFGSKMAHHHRAHVDGALSRVIREYKTIDDLLPNHRWVWLIRRDKVAQAVSLSRAEQSGIWLSYSGARQRASEPIFDYHHILSRLMVLCVCDVAWQTYFQANGITPYVLYYEEFFDNLLSSLSDLVCYLGGRPCGHGPDVDTAATLAVSTR